MEMSGGFGERITMICAVCSSAHHDSSKEVYVHDAQTGAYRKAICPLCVCLDCCQLHNDPIRSKIRPLMMGQTLAQQYHLTVDEHLPGQPARKRNITIKAPGPLNVPEAIKAMGDLMGLQGPEAPPRHNLQQSVPCNCSKNAVSKCIACEMPLCIKCLKTHDCG
jgi:hypothetical protein